MRWTQGGQGKRRRGKGQTKGKRQQAKGNQISVIRRKVDRNKQKRARANTSTASFLHILFGLDFVSPASCFAESASISTTNRSPSVSCLSFSSCWISGIDNHASQVEAFPVQQPDCRTYPPFRAYHRPFQESDLAPFVA